MTQQADTTAAATDTTKAADAGNADTTKAQDQTQTQNQTDTQIKTDDKQADGGDKGAATDKTEVVLFDPAKVKLPDGYTMDESLMKEFSPFAAELKLNHESGQKMVDMYTKGIQSQVQKMEAHYKQEADAQVTRWKDESTADKEFGGAKLQESLAIAGKAIARFGSPQLKEMLDVTGLGNHPEVIRAFMKIGRQISEDTIGATDGGEAGAKKDPAATMYDHPTSKPQS